MDGSRLWELFLDSFGKILLSGLTVTILPQAMRTAFPPLSNSLIAAINEALAELAESGQLSELSEKYFGTDISQES